MERILESGGPDMPSVEPEGARFARAGAAGSTTDWPDCRDGCRRRVGLSW